MFKLLRNLLFVSSFSVVAFAAFAQNAAQGGAQPAAAGGLSSLSPDEKSQMDAAGRDFKVEKYSDALAIYKPLVAAHPGEPMLAKFAAESAINAGEREYATGLLAPILAANPQDWQATALLTRIYAENGNKAGRDAEMARMAELHDRGVIPAQLQQYLLEAVHQDGKTLRIWHSLVPWGNQKVYDYARVFDANGGAVLQIEMESMDIDQTFFAKNHPAEAAAGVRVFSFDTFSQGAAQANGTRSYTHGTVDMFAGKPTYDAVHAAFVQIAFGKYERQATSLFNPQPAAPKP